MGLAFQQIPDGFEEPSLMSGADGELFNDSKTLRMEMAMVALNLWDFGVYGVVGVGFFWDVDDYNQWTHYMIAGGF